MSSSGLEHLVAEGRLVLQASWMTRILPVYSTICSSKHPSPGPAKLREEWTEVHTNSAFVQAPAGIFVF